MGLEVGVQWIEDLDETWPLNSEGLGKADDHMRNIKTALVTQFPNLGAGAVTATYTEINKLTGYTGDIPEVGTVQNWTAQQYFGEATLTESGGSVAWDLDGAQCAKLTQTGNWTLSNPTNMKAGATYVLRVIQSGSGNVLNFGSNYRWVGGVEPDVSAVSGDIDILSFYSDGTYMYGTLLPDYS